MTTAVIEQDIQQAKLLDFMEKVSLATDIEGAGILYKGTEHKGVPILEDSFEILHHLKKFAYTIPVATVLDDKVKVDDVVVALVTGIFDKVYNITRIVGYYSRVQNWNSSKVGELRDRHRGDYSVAKVA